MASQINDRMRDPVNLIGDERGCVTMHCTHGHMVGYLALKDAARFVARGWAYVLTTSDCVEYECGCGKSPNNCVEF
jgi:hypothetical protein